VVVKRSVRCIHCNKYWNTGSLNLKVTCPSCGLKTPNKTMEEIRKERLKKKHGDI